MDSGSIDELLSDPSEALYRLISYTARDLRRSYQEDFKRWGLTGAQFGVLLGAAGSGSISDIANQLLTDPTSVGRIIERMETVGLVERYRKAEDRRVVWVRLKPEGEAALARILPEHVALAKERLGFLDDSGYAALTTLLNEVRSYLATMTSSTE